MLTFHHCFFNLKTGNPILNSTYVFIPHANIHGSYRVFTTYGRAQSSSIKKDLGELTGMHLDKQWHWHHVVEGTHLPPLFGDDVCRNLYREQIPCVLVDHHTEHKDYNALLHSSGAKAVFGLPHSKALLQGQQRAAYLNNLKSLYSQAYSHDKVLKTVALNILAQM
jgi:response regulator RpfG family c-di-GMP phosphodiesterase